MGSYDSGCSYHVLVLSISMCNYYELGNGCIAEYLSKESSDVQDVIPISFFHILTLCLLFSTILKEHGYFERNTLKRNLTYSCFIFPLFHEHLLFSPGLPRATRLLETSCLEKITVCVIETMLVTLPLVQMNKARREVNQRIKHRSR